MLWFLGLPVAGAFFIRRSWRRFRRRFDELRATPRLDYRYLRAVDESGRDFRFFGGFESVTDDRTLWVRGENCTVAADLENAAIYLLPLSSNDRRHTSSPAKIKWDQVSALSYGVGIFIGGLVRLKNGSVRFESTKEKPLLIILYDGSEHTMLARTVQAGRQKNEYWNPVTPSALALGVFTQLFIALIYAYRPLYGLAFAAALVSAFTPLLPLLPPGMFVTAVYNRWWQKALSLRVARDLVRLPLRHLPDDCQTTILPDGSSYGYIELPPELPPETSFVPRLPPNSSVSLAEPYRWYGLLGAEFPRLPADPAAVFAITAGNPKHLAEKYITQARLHEIGSGLAFLSGIAINAVLLFAFILILR